MINPNPSVFTTRIGRVLMAPNIDPERDAYLVAFPWRAPGDRGVRWVPRKLLSEAAAGRLRPVPFTPDVRPHHG